MNIDQFYDKTVYFHVTCHGLKNKNTISKMDTFCVLEMSGKEIDRSEVQHSNQNPTFLKPLALVRSSYLTDSPSNASDQVTFTIYHSYFANRKSHEDFVGRVNVNMSLIANSEKQLINLTLVDKDDRDIGSTVTIRMEDKTAKDFSFDLQFAGSDLAKKDLFGKSDPFFVLSREINGREIVIYKSEKRDKTLDPIWASFRMTYKTFCDCSDETIVKMMVYDWDSLTDSDFIGECTFTFKEVKKLGLGSAHFPIKDGKKLTGKIFVRNLDLKNMPSSI